MFKIFNRRNLKKVYYYLRRNGLKSVWYAAGERISQANINNYCYQTPDMAELDRQRREAVKSTLLFSILVPAYETDPVYLKEMLCSVLHQTYGRWELIIVDAGHSDTVERTVDAYADERLRYRRLPDNRGISENTNEALSMARGDYVGLLDHDDLLTPDALYEMAEAVRKSAEKGTVAELLYSDEDKGNGECTVFSEPHRKPDLNVELLLSNNYICHFLVMKREMMESLRFRPAYDGAQDYDLILRGVKKLMGKKETVIHIPKVLYHWRCHSGSTAENPESKGYAYEAGRRAVEDFIKNAGWKAKVTGLRHLGFYRVEYLPDIFAQRPDVGVTGGRLLDSRNKITGGIYDAAGQPLYAGLPGQYSGYMHRASLMQEACAVDVRCMKVREALWGIFEETFGVPYREKEGLFDWKSITVSAEDSNEGREEWFRRRSLDFCKRAAEDGFRVIWVPEETVKIKTGKGHGGVTGRAGRDKPGWK